MLAIAFALIACVPDATDQADFYELCSNHVAEYLKPGDKVLDFEAVRHSADYLYWKNSERAGITTFVRSSGAAKDSNQLNQEQVRKCSFKVAGSTWRVE